MNDIMRDWSSCLSSSCSIIAIHARVWTPSPAGHLKLNFDGLARANPSPAGYGCIIHDETSNAVLVFCGHLGIGD